MASALASHLLIVLDRDYGSRLRGVLPGRPVWIELSPANEPVVRELWQQICEPSHLTGITGLRFQPASSGEERFLAELDTIDLHHGAYSSSVPYTEFEVVGCTMSNRMRTALTEIGFTEFEEHQHGFLARRTQKKPRSNGKTE